MAGNGLLSLNVLLLLIDKSVSCHIASPYTYIR